MRTPDDPAPLYEQPFSSELRALLAEDAVWAVPPPDLLADILAALSPSRR